MPNRIVDVKVDGIGKITFELSPADIETLRGSPLDIAKILNGGYGLEKLFWDKLSRVNEGEYLMFGSCDLDGRFVLKDDIDTDSLYEGWLGAVGVVVVDVDDAGNRTFNPVYARATAEDFFGREIIDSFSRQFWVDDIDFTVGWKTYSISSDEIAVDWAASFTESSAYDQAFEDWVDDNIDSFDVVDIQRSNVPQVIMSSCHWSPMFT